MGAIVALVTVVLVVLFVQSIGVSVILDQDRYKGRHKALPLQSLQHDISLSPSVLSELVLCCRK